MSAIGSHKGASSLVFSPDGQKLVSGSDKTLEIRDFPRGQIIKKIDAHEDYISRLDISSDGRQILSASSDRTAKLWDLETGGLIHSFEGHSHAVVAAKFSADQKRVVTTSSDRISRIWDAKSRQLEVIMYADAQDEWIVMTSEGFFNCSPEGAKLLSVVKDLEALPAEKFYQALFRPDLVREKLAGDPKGKIGEAAARLDLGKVLLSGAAPSIELFLPPNPSSAAEIISAEARIIDRGGGIGRVEWRVNGTTLGVEEFAAKDLPAAGQPLTVRKSLSLEPGENRVEVLAYNAKGLIASDPASASLLWNGKRAGGGTQLFVVSVGVNDYWDSRLRLSYAVPDAIALAEGFKRSGSDLYASVEATTVLDADVTAANLDRVFAELRHKVRPNDVFMFFIAGHGKTIDGRYYYLPRDFRYEGEESIAKNGIGQDRFQSWFAQIPARKSVLLYDTCESGSLTGDRVQQRGIERVAALDRLTRAMGRTVLSAATDDAPALEGYKGHGVFSYVVLDALGRADINGDSLIDVTEFAGYIDRAVPEVSYTAFKMRQVPQMKIVGSNYPLLTRTAVLEPGEVMATIPMKPTHVVIAQTKTRSLARGTDTVSELSPGTQVTLVEAVDGWTLIAKDGRNIGYVEDTALIKLQ